MEKKQAADWYLTLVHCSIAGFVVPFLIMLAVVLVTFPFIAFDSNGNFINLTTNIIVSIAMSLIGAVAIWLGVRFSAKYLKRKYVFTNPRRILNLSTTYFVGIWIAVGFLSAVIIGTSDDPPMLSIDQIMSNVDMVVGALVFYFATKKHFLG